MCRRLTCLGSLVLALGFQAAGPADAKLADAKLEISNVSCDPNTLYPGQAMEPYLYVYNSGDETAYNPSSTIYFSDRPQLGQGDSMVLWAGTWLVESIPAGQGRGISWPPEQMSNPITCPYGWPQGTYYIIIELSHGGATDYTSVTLLATPLATLPTVVTQPATGVGPTYATLQGRITDDGGEPCAYRFRYREINRVTWQNTDWSGNKRSGETFSDTASGLSPGTTYVFRADARNSVGMTQTDDSDWLFFTTGESNGVTAEYFAGIFPQGTPCLVQTEPDINHDWRGGEVACGLSERVSARWTANLEIPSAGTYTFSAYSDDGAMVWLNGMSIIDNWTRQGSMSSLPLQLKAGDYTLRMEWYQNVGEAFAQLLWERPGMEPEIVPQTRLRPSPPSYEPDGNGPVTGIASIGIDSFEHYTNDFNAGQAVFQTWIGGAVWPNIYPGPLVPDNKTGAIVGHDIWSPGTPYDTIMETEIVYSGNQSMPVYYDNSKPPFYSRVDRTWEGPQNWAVEGIDTLSIRVHGQPGNNPAQLYIEVEDNDGVTGRVFNSDLDLLQRDEWIQWKIPLSDFTDQDVNPKEIKRMSIGMGDPVNVIPQNAIGPMQVGDSDDYSLVLFELLQLLRASGIQSGLLGGFVWEEGTNKPIQKAKVILDPNDHSGPISCLSVERGYFLLDPNLKAWYNLSVAATEDYEIYMESGLKFEDYINVKMISLKPVKE